MADVTDVKASTRDKVSKRSFVDKDGNWAGRVSVDTVGFKIDILSEDGEVAHTIDKALGDFTEGVLNAAAAFGLVTAITNTFGGIKGPRQEVVDAAEERLAALLEGDWSTDRQSGPRTSHILDAAIAVAADAGKEVTEEWKEKFIARYKSDEEFAKALNKDAVFQAKLTAIKAKAAQERATKAAEAAKDVKSVLFD